MSKAITPQDMIKFLKSHIPVEGGPDDVMLKAIVGHVAHGAEERARLFATAAHAAKGQVRKYTGEPYINHPAAVVEILKGRPHTTEMICAAWLHDVVEDTGVTLEMIEEEFGHIVAALVSDLTDTSKPEHGNREYRKSIDLIHTSHAHPRAKTIKLADLIDNTKSIVARDPDFAKVYLAEKRKLLEVLTEGDSILWQRAYDMAQVVV